ncbi:hypothetical protein P3T76_009262 [Phytophthora citrophthora]|uniref:Crinkler effector protein N-terminal domain-containing protein n=1 Tax=Phytophthora citrophthora TaxID=4793 RepID=A0AAD9GGK7_9STRA|nr:hypothetical protein P3T76_009262 [Phytophthora citrophthora]
MFICFLKRNHTSNSNTISADEVSLDELSYLGHHGPGQRGKGQYQELLQSLREPIQSSRDHPDATKMITIFCVIVGEGQFRNFQFSVNIIDNAYITDLQRAIKAEHEFIKCPASHLHLFLAKTKDGKWLKVTGTVGMTADETGELPGVLDSHGVRKEFVWMEPFQLIKDPNYFGTDFQPRANDVHVLVVVPGDVSQPVDSSRKWLRDFLTKRVEFNALPPVEDLKAFVQQPLTVRLRAKSKWLTTWNFGPELQEKILAVDDASPSMEFKNTLFGKCVLSSAGPGETESSYRITRDMVFRNVLDLATRAQCERGPLKTPRAVKCPDFYCILDGVCIFRAEEEGPNASISVATSNLCSKLVRTFGQVPYLFGYVASADNKVVEKTVIGEFDLKRKEQRVEAILAMLNLSLLFPAIVEACPDSGKDEYRDITRWNGYSLVVGVRLFPTFVVKILPDTSCSDHLERIYGQMKQARVPNVDHLTALHFQNKSLVLEPRGMKKKPTTLLELFHALRDVLEALVGLHRLGWIHRNIR